LQSGIAILVRIALDTQGRDSCVSTFVLRLFFFISVKNIIEILMEISLDM
jgi:hypothetical protein